MPLPAARRRTPAAPRAPQWHIAEAIRVFERVFGARPAGCWPAEGAISGGDACSCIAAAGFRWAASSAAVLRGSLALADPEAAQEPASLQPPVPPCRGPASTASSAMTPCPT